MSDITGDQTQNDDPRVLAAVQEYMALLEAGRHPSRREFLLRYPDVATELGACLDGLAFVQSAVGQIAGPPKLDEPEHELSGAQPLGDFRIVREIGRGGMGVVYEAVQLSLGRRVALKVLPMAAAMDRKHLERFHNEAQAAAQLHHTNIVPVYAVGCERSVHYYAMQLIEGQSLADVIRDLRAVAGGEAKPEDVDGGATVRMDRVTGLPAEPVLATCASHTSPATTSGGLSTLRASRRGTAYARSVAALALQIAEALDYAHRAGVVHRDIKPANLLLDARGSLWITDFGLAQVYADRDLTRSGDMIGTLRYMSPEQASGRAVVLDQRTDLYSLGVTLYELLTLERAFTGTTHEALLYQVAYEEPKPMRAIDRTIPRELEVIIGKAIAKEPAERYQTARAMADDLRRFLADEPILARPPTKLDKAIKWVRRHRAWAAAAVVALALSTVTLTVSNVLIAHAKHNTQVAYQLEWERAVEAETQRQLAEHSWAEARQAVDFFTEIAIGMDRPEFSQTRHAMLEESLAYYQAFMDERRDDPAMADELKAAQARVSTSLGLFEALDASVRAENRVRLLRDSAVRNALGLTSEQAAAAAALADKYGRGAFGPNGPLSDSGSGFATSTTSPAQRQLRFAAWAQEIDAAIVKAIGPDAAERLKQISRQLRGVMAFSDPDVLAKLGLSRSQRTSIHRVQAAARNARRGPGRHGPGGDDELGGDTQALAEAVKLLTSAQATTWAQLVGEAVDVKTLGRDFDGGHGRHGFGDGRGDFKPD